MNTSKQIAIIVGLVFLSVLLTGAYTMWDPTREENARGNQTDATIERAAWLYSQNCRTCHGDAGEGGAASNRLRVAPPLDRSDLQGVDEEGEVSETLKAQQFDLIVNTITCGRVGKAMPTWGQSQGGTLNEEQIRQLAVLITEGTGWGEAEEFALHGFPPNGFHGDADVDFALTGPIGEDDTEIVLAPAGEATTLTLTATERIQVDDELMVITEADRDTFTVTVERGFGTTSAEAHEQDATLLKPPVPPDPPQITERACGQIAGAEAGATPTPEPPSATLTIASEGIAFNKAELFALPAVPLTLTHDNEDAGQSHNIAFYDGEDANADLIAGTDPEGGPVVQTLNFGPLEIGDYFYQCDIHPGQMEGFLHVQEAGAAAPAAPAATTPTPAGGATTPSAP